MSHDNGVRLGPSASEQWLDAPEHLAMVLARYRAAAALIGRASAVLELGCGEGIGARSLAVGALSYMGFDRDEAALESARGLAGDSRDGCAISFVARDVSQPLATSDGWDGWDAVVALDVIEHLGADGGEMLVENARRMLRKHGVCVIGTPSVRFRHLASARSRAEHRTLYTEASLTELVAQRFRVVQSFGMQDTALHFGHPDARHYLLVVGIMPR